MARSQRHKVDVQSADSRGSIVAEGEVFEPSGFFVDPSQIGGLVDNPYMDGVHVSTGAPGGPLAGSSTSGAIPAGAIGPTPESPPTNVVPPSITGSAIVGSAVFMSVGVWNGFPTPTYTVQWQRSPNGATAWANISGATGSSYVVQAGDAGYYLRVFVTATNSEGLNTASSTPTVQVAPASVAPTNSIVPAITGSPIAGNVLTSTGGTWNGYPVPMLTYQWQRSDNGTTGWTNIAGANSSSYILQAADVTKYVRSTVTATNTVGTASANSSATLQITGVAPVNTSSPSVSGILTVGSTLSLDGGTWTGVPAPTFTYQWQRSDDGSTGWADISGATASTYVLQAGDSGKYVRVQVTGTNSTAAATANSASTAQVGTSLSAPVNVSVPTFTGTVTSGQTLLGASGSWTGNPSPSYAYKWQRSANGTSGWADIFGATSINYTLQAADYGQYVRLQVTGTNTQGSSTGNSASSTQVAGVAPANTTAPSFTGTTTAGQLLTGASGTWNGVPSPTYAYKWQRSDNGTSGWADISGATSINYTLQAADYDKYVRLQVTGTNGLGSSTANSVASAKIAGTLPTNSTAPTVSGSATVGQLLTSTSGVWAGVPTPTYAYQWQRSTNGTTGWTNIAGASSSTYTLQAADVGMYIRSQVTATNAVGSGVATTSPTTQIAGTAPANTVVPVLSGTANVGQVLSGSNGTWTGVPAPTYTYQWQRSDNGTTGWGDIGGATANTYTILLADDGKYLRLRVTATNNAGNASALSAASAQVSQTTETGQVTFNGDQMTYNGDPLIFTAA